MAVVATCEEEWKMHVFLLYHSCYLSFEADYSFFVQIEKNCAGGRPLHPKKIRVIIPGNRTSLLTSFSFFFPRQTSLWDPYNLRLTMSVIILKSVSCGGALTNLAHMEHFFNLFAISQIVFRMLVDFLPALMEYS